MGFDPQHILAAQQRLECNRQPKTVAGYMVNEIDAVPAGDEVEKLHKPALKWLTEHGIAYVPNRPARRSTATEGAPDFTIAAGAGRVVFVEFKTIDGKLSVKQREWHFLAERSGTTVHVIRSFGKFLELMKSVSNERVMRIEV